MSIAEIWAQSYDQQCDGKIQIYIFLTDKKPSQLILNWLKRLTQRIWFKAHHSEAENWLPFSEDGLQNSAKKSSMD